MDLSLDRLLNDEYSCVGRTIPFFVSLTLCMDFGSILHWKVKERNSRHLHELGLEIKFFYFLFLFPHLGCGGVWLSRWLPAFHRNLLPLSLQ